MKTYKSLKNIETRFQIFNDNKLKKLNKFAQLNRKFLL